MKCDTDLSDVDILAVQRVQFDVDDFDYEYGETDLLESSLRQKGRFYTVFGLTLMTTLLIVLGVFWLKIDSSTFIVPLQEDATAQIISSPSPRPTLNIATVTQGPPTATYTFTPAPTFTPSDTPTRGPCTITMPQGQSLIWALAQCGHQSLDVMPTVLALNNLADAGQVQSGQAIEIPWPTSTEDPNAQAASQNGSAAVSTGVESAFAVNEEIQAFAATTTPTLPPGVMWHQVQPNENIISVAVQYHTDVQTLSQLNRQIDFALCDFGETYGGKDCIVQLFQGQLLRVPAPTPTPTLSPTPDPNATATPTATATYNEPNVFSPSDHQFFYVNELVTLRWIPTATLNPGDLYRVDVHDITSGLSYVDYTTEVFYIIPKDWQGKLKERHEFEWTVGIVNQQDLNNIRFQTETHSFVWQGQIEGGNSQ